MTALEQMGKNAKVAARKLGTLQEKKDAALTAIAAALREKTPEILAANAIDLQSGEQNGMTSARMDRLRLTPERIEGMAAGVDQIAGMTDPIGEVLTGKRLPNGLRIEQVRVPLGVIGIIYEARPNVTADAAALCLKAGSAVILRGGKEAFSSNRCITNVMREAIAKAGLPEDCIQLVQDTSRESAKEMMGLTDYLDVLIPRGGAGLIRSVVENSRVPVIQTGAGNCHVYVDEFADIPMAAEIIFNAKTQRPSVCNAIETILVHRNIAEKALPVIKAKLDEKPVELRGCPLTCEILKDITKAEDADWATEYLDYILAVKVVDSIDEAMNHIAQYSTGHSECIVTESYHNANRFTEEVDCAAVYVNASTRFTDGGMFGMGAEIGISTQKLHARGPMGLAQLTSTKFIVRGDGQVR